MALDEVPAAEAVGEPVVVTRLRIGSVLATFLVLAAIVAFFIAGYADHGKSISLPVTAAHVLIT
ncbi:hypothetical protein GXW82_43850 [Streptacidiphilus sp. 4-A2]|nr:hypothetical protein [Streptacidiphilus sp. 4-A2]